MSKYGMIRKKCRDEAVVIGLGIGLLALFSADEAKRDACQERFLSCFKNYGGTIEKSYLTT